jgi:cytochrome P450
MHHDLPTPPYIEGMQRVDGYAEIEHILRSKDFVQGAHRESAPFFGDTLLLTDGSAHMERRQLLSALVTRSSLRHYEATALKPVIAEVLDELSASKDSSGVVHVDLVDMLRTLLHRITATVTGVDDVDTPERTERFRFLVEKIGEAVTVEWSTRDHAGVIAEGMHHRRDMIEEFLEPSVMRRRELVARMKAGALSKEDLPTDLLTMLVLHGLDDFDGDEGYIWREAALFLVGATQTTTHTLPHVLVHLNEWFDAHPEDREKVSDRHFLRLAAAEALRLHQPAPVLLRTAKEDLELPSGRKVAKGERVALFFSPANREEEVFGSDAQKYNPYREVPKRVQHWGLTFGSGEHLCIGRPLVLGMPNNKEADSSTDGTLVSILDMLFECGVRMDPENPPVKMTTSYHDAYESMMIFLDDVS